MAGLLVVPLASLAAQAAALHVGVLADIGQRQVKLRLRQRGRGPQIPDVLQARFT